MKVDDPPDDKNEQLLSRWPRVKGDPHLFDAQGRLMTSQNTGELESGHD